MPASMLLVDDDKVTAELNAAYLRAAGYQVSAAYDAMQRFRMANRGRAAAG